MTSEVASDGENQKKAGTRRLALLIPLIGFLALSGFFLYALNSGDPSRLPSALINKPVPQFKLPPVEALVDGGNAVPGFSNADLSSGKVSVVNVWASWCVPCHAEHPFLGVLAKESKAPLYGINYKDKPGEARRFLEKLGNPFVAVGADESGRIGIDWGVYGVPETYVISGDGRIVYKHVGPLNMSIIKARILPAIEKTRNGTSSPTS